MASRISTLIQLLHDKTSEGKLVWTITQDDGEYQATFSDFGVRVYKVGADFHIAVYNSSGELVEDVSDPQVKPDLQNAFKIMREIFEMARRKALGVDDVLDKIIGELSKEKK
jgi:hypothetical protein